MFRKMDELEIQIEEITQLKMVHIYELTGGELTAGDHGCTAMAVYFGETGQMNLSVFDPHFMLLQQKVMDLYRNATNKDGIMMDAATRSILESGVRNRQEEELSFFYGRQALEYPVLPYEAMLGQQFLPLAEYYLVGLYETLGLHLTITGKREGWRGAALLLGLRDQQEVHFHVQITRIDYKRVRIAISNFIESTGSLQIQVCLDDRMTECTFVSGDERFHGYSRYLFGTDQMREEHEAYCDDRKIFIEREATERIADLTPEKELLFLDRPVKAIYILPWRMDYLLYDKESLEGETLVHSFGGVYLYEEAHMADIRSFTELHNEGTDVRMTVEGYRMYRMRLQDQRIQTYFAEPQQHTSGTYREQLTGKYFITE